MSELYTTSFYLTNPVNDFNAAAAFLDNAGDQRGALWQDSQCPQSAIEAVEHVYFELMDEESGRISVYASRALTFKEMDGLSCRIRGMCSDGIGESFEQQGFAWEEYVDENGFGVGDGEMSSFDWRTNSYQLQHC